MAAGTTLSASPEPAAEIPARAGGHARFSRVAWAALAYLVAVIQFGAWVRITGSGAGCGSHWPTCHGEIIPRSPAVETVIEYTHRVSSGLLGLLVIGVAVGATLLFPGWHRVRVAAWVTLAFTLLEAAIGAKLVLAGLVASDDSVARAVTIALHLVSTFTLTGAAGLVAWWSRPRTGSSRAPSATPAGRAVLAVAAVALLAVSMTGAVTALGDTLFPVAPAAGEGLLARLDADLDPASHFLVRLRIVHPALAVCVAALLVLMPTYLGARAVGDCAFDLLRKLRWAVLFQVAVGVASIALGAPGWVQLLHLLLAQGVWLLFVLAAAEAWLPRSEGAD